KTTRIRQLIQYIRDDEPVRRRTVDNILKFSAAEAWRKQQGILDTPLVPPSSRHALLELYPAFYPSVANILYRHYIIGYLQACLITPLGNIYIKPPSPDTAADLLVSGIDNDLRENDFAIIQPVANPEDPTSYEDSFVREPGELRKEAARRLSSFVPTLHLLHRSATLIRLQLNDNPYHYFDTNPLVYGALVGDGAFLADLVACFASINFIEAFESAEPPLAVLDSRYFRFANFLLYLRGTNFRGQLYRLNQNSLIAKYPDKAGLRQHLGLTMLHYLYQAAVTGLAALGHLDGLLAFQTQFRKKWQVRGGTIATTDYTARIALVAAAKARQTGVIGHYLGRVKANSTLPQVHATLRRYGWEEARSQLGSIGDDSLPEPILNHNYQNEGIVYFDRKLGLVTFHCDGSTIIQSREGTVVDGH
ncbi:hypothetical protein IWQ60_004341, partial [Tieghemiomyces parasiticus]